MSSHLEFRQLNEYLDNELNKDELELVRFHLRECSQCQQELDGLKTLRLELASGIKELADKTHLPLGWEERLARRYKASFASENARWWEKVLSRPYRPLVALATAALVLLALYLPMENRVPSKRPPDQQELETPQSLPRPEKEMRLFGLDQRGAPEQQEAPAERVRVFTSKDEQDVQRVFLKLQEAGLRPILRGNEIMVETINQKEAERIVEETINK